jgi:tripartite ATP-independent transporter DctM subunit
MISAIMTAIFFVLICFRFPVSISIGLSAMVGLIMKDTQFLIIPQYMASGVQNPALLAVPFFILAGNLMNSMGLTRRIFSFAQTLVGHVKGGLAQVNVVASMIFAGISGAALADCAGLGLIEINAMTAFGYRKPFAAAVTLASSVIGPIIPPSIVMIIYAIMAEVSVAKIFVAGVIPGLIIGVSVMAMNYYFAARGIEPCPTVPRQPVGKIAKSFFKNSLALIAPVIILWGLFVGMVTPSEAGIIAILYSILVGLIYRDVKPREFFAGLQDSVKSTAIIMFIIGVSTVMGWVYTADGIPQKIANFLIGVSQNKYLILALINVFLLILGCILEPIPVLIITTPILLPVIQQIDVDLVHFGIIMCYNTTVGIITPPMGIGLYVIMGITDITFEDLVKSSIWYLIPLIGSLFLISFVPQLALWLPGLFWTQ